MVNLKLYINILIYSMDFTFGIITQGINDVYISEIVNSIYKQNIPNYEIIIIGNSTINGYNITNIKFDETIKNGWITKKKNIICEKAKYDNIVLMHDYISLENKWYEGFLEFGNNFDICINKIITINNRRFRDYTIFPFDLGYPFNKRALVPYDIENNNISKLLYISGTYYVIKKELALKFPLNDKLCWGQGEDVELSKILIQNNIQLKCNKYSVVKLLKNKDQCEWEVEMNEDDIKYILSLSDKQIDDLLNIQITHINNYIKLFI
jgi:hypothetical protein